MRSEPSEPDSNCRKRLEQTLSCQGKASDDTGHLKSLGSADLLGAKRLDNHRRAAVR